MISETLAVNSPMTAVPGNRSQDIQSPATAVNGKLSRAEAEECRWNLEWARRNVED